MCLQKEINRHNKLDRATHPDAKMEGTPCGMPSIGLLTYVLFGYSMLIV